MTLQPGWFKKGLERATTELELLNTIESIGINYSNPEKQRILIKWFLKLPVEEQQEVYDNWAKNQS